MNQRGISGLLLVAGACALVVAWMSQGQLPSTARAGEGAEIASNATVLLRMPRDATIASPQPFHLDAAMARAAVRDGELRVALPDGTTYPVRIERQFTDGTGHWNVVGRVQTPLGAQAMVLTFGPDAVFGVLPKPDGTLMQVTTGPGGAVTIAPAGELIPDVPGAQDHTDVRIPPRPKPPVDAAQQAKARAANAASAQKVRLETSADARTTPIAKTAIASAAPIDTTPVQIDVLALYSQELVALRGSDAAARTEVANLFALANQAHLDSGSRVRLQAVGTQQLTLPAGLFNGDVLDRIVDRTIGVDLESIRDTHSADLATIIRPYQANDYSCGVAWLQGEGIHRNHHLAADYAYSVVAVSPCDPYVLAHELGHSMGSMHDRASSTDPTTGALTYGAYAFSFGHRTRAARTIMAYSSGQPRIGRFSSPAILACGTPCGVDERADNVRSLNLMAPSIATFRGPKGTASIADVELVEHVALHQRIAYVPIRLSGPAPSPYAMFDVEVIGGTATQGVDYLNVDSSVTVTPGFRSAGIRIDLPGDDDIEPDETIELRITPSAGSTMPVQDAIGKVTIVADDPRPIVTAKFWFPPGLPSEGMSGVLEVYGAHGFDERTDWDYFLVPAENNTYRIPVAYGSPLHIEYGQDHTRRYAMTPARVQEVRGDRELPLMLRSTHKVTGQVVFAPGTTLPTFSVRLDLREDTDGIERYSDIQFLRAPDYRFTTYVAEGASLELAHPAIDTNPGTAKSWQAYLQHVTGDVVIDPVLSTSPSVLAYGPGHVSRGARFPVIVQLSEDATGTGVGFRYRTVDGTAKAGVDYVAASGTSRIAAGAYKATIDLQLLSTPRGQGSKYFDVVIDQISGATGATTTVRTWISDQGVRAGGPQAPQRQ